MTLLEASPTSADTECDATIDADSPPGVAEEAAASSQTNAQDSGENVLLSGWATPKAQNANSPHPHGNGGQGLQEEAQLTGWATPRSTESHSTGNPERAQENNDQVFLAGWPTPNSVEPEGPKGNPAQFSVARRTKEPQDDLQLGQDGSLHWGDIVCWICEADVKRIVWRNNFEIAKRKWA